MVELRYNNETALSCNGNDMYKQMAFDGCNYYFLNNYKVVKYDNCFEEIEEVRTYRDYDNFCYDFKEDVFWATSKKCPYKIFKLSCCFKEIDCIQICTHEYCDGMVTGISYDCCKDSLLVSFLNCIVLVCKEDESTTLVSHSCHEWITGVFSLCPGYIVTSLKDKKQIVSIYDECNRLVNQFCVPCKFKLENIIFNPCRDKKHDNKCDCDSKKEYDFDVFVVKKGCYPYVITTTLTECELSFTPCHCNYESCKDCDKEKCRKEHACIQIVESIALVEAAISEILVAESKKIKKVITLTDDIDDIDEIICVNKQVNQMIVNVTHLEQVLYNKLSKIKECCPDICEDECEKSCKKCCE